MLCRCEQHEWPEGTDNSYIAKIESAGSKNQAVICGRCERPGAIFLNRGEYQRFKDGERVFTLKQANILGIKLSDDPEEVREVQSAGDTSW